MEDILSELGAGPRTKLVRTKLKGLVPRIVRKPRGTSVVDRGIAAFMGAMAKQSAIENARPNRAYSLIADDPSKPIDPTDTPTFRFTLPTDAFLVYWAATDNDQVDFLISSLKVAGYDVVGGSPINLASFLSVVNRIDRPGPLTGRLFDGGTTIECTIRNISGAPRLFRGLTVWMISTDCASSTKGKPAPSILNFRSLTSGFRNLFSRRGIKR